MRVIGKRPLFGRQVSEKPEAPDAIGADSPAVDPQVAPHKVAQVVPVEFRAVLEFLHEPRGIERVPRLPELQHHEPADDRLIERPGRVYSEIINVARFVALIEGADFFSKDFGQGNISLTPTLSIFRYAKPPQEGGLVTHNILFLALRRRWSELHKFSLRYTIALYIKEG